jgi:hypothetical protein
MIKMLRMVAILVPVGSFAGLAVAQGKQGDAFGNDVASLLAKLEAQCAHRRRTMPPDPIDDCARKLRDAQLASGQGGASASSQASGAGPGNGAGQGLGPGNAGGQGNGLGPGNGGGLAKGRR